MPTKIAVVDDNEAIRIIFKHLFKGNDFELKTAENGRKGLALIQETRPDVAFIDLYMPVMNGMELVEAIPKEVKTQTDIIFITSEPSEENIKTCYRLGANSFLRKPVSPNEIMHLVDNCIQRRRDREMLRSAAEEWRKSFDALDDIIFIIDSDCRILNMNKACEEITGCKVSDVVGRPCHDMFKDSLCYQGACPARTMKKVPLRLESYFKHFDRYFEISYHPVMDGDTVQSYIVSFKDNTEVKRSEEKVLQRLRLEENISACSQLLLSSDQSIRRVFPQALEKLIDGLPVDRIVIYKYQSTDPGKQVFSREFWLNKGVLPDSGRETGSVPCGPLQRWLDTFVKHGVVAGNCSDFPDAEQAFFKDIGILSTLMIPIFVHADFYGFIAYDNVLQARRWESEDISILMNMSELIGSYLYRKKAENALRDSEAKYRQLVENLEDIILRIRPDFQLSYVSSSFFRMFDAVKGQVGGLTLKNLPVGDQAFLESFCGSVSTVFREGRTCKDTFHINLDDQDKWLDIRVFPESSDSGKTASVLAIIRDITNEKRVEQEAARHKEQLIQAEKMTTLGTLVSGIGHEINNPNSFIMLNAPVMQDIMAAIYPEFRRYCQDNGIEKIGKYKISSLEKRIPQLLQGINEGSVRIRNIVQSLKDYARQGSTAMDEDISINDIVSTAVMLVLHKVKISTDDFDVFYEEGLPTVKGNFQRIEQVVVNLILNACDATRDSQTSIKVSTGMETAKKTVFVRVEDTGSGIPPDVINKIRDPFFTTKRDQGGTGLGLAISSSIVHDHKGELVFDSVEGRGTTVTLSLPIGH